MAARDLKFWPRFMSALSLKEISAPATPAAGTVNVYGASGGVVRVKNSSGDDIILDPSKLEKWSAQGSLSVRTGAARFRFPIAGKILSVGITVGTAPTGAAILVDVNKNGTTIFTTQANRPSIAGAGFASSDAVPDVTSAAVGDYMTVDIDQVGSTIAGADLTVTVRWVPV